MKQLLLLICVQHLLPFVFCVPVFLYARCLGTVPLTCLPFCATCLGVQALFSHLFSPSLLYTLYNLTFACVGTLA